MLGVQNHQNEVLPADYHPLWSAGLASVGLLILIAGQVFFAPTGMEFVAADSLDSLAAEGPSQLASDGAPETEVPATGEAPNQPPQVDLPTTEVENFDDNARGEFVGDPTPTDENPTGDKPPEHTQPADRLQRVIHYSVLDKPIEVSNEPALGNVFAEQVVVELLDYTCPHCRKLHPYIQQAAERYGDSLGIVIYHVPLSRHCNPYVKLDQSLHSTACDYARFAISVWSLAPQHFAEYHDWLMQGEKAPPIHKARNKAIELVGMEVLLDKSLGIDANRRIAVHVEEMKQLNSGLPIVVTSKGFIRGVPKSDEEWFSFYEKILSLKPVGAEL